MWADPLPARDSNPHFQDQNLACCQLHQPGSRFQSIGKDDCVPVLVGTSGWMYADWRGRYYPDRLPQSKWFTKVMTDFRTVELNVSFYRLPKREVFEGWRDRSPDDAIIAAKASRYLTHIKRLRDPQPSVELFVSRATGLGEKLGPVLVQLPPDLQVNVEALRETLAAFPRDVRIAVEPRHESWWIDEVHTLPEQFNAALCWADRKQRAMTPLWGTADWGYLRFHQGCGIKRPSYSGRSLAEWSERIASTYADDEDVFVYFNNDPGCAAVDDAITFAEELRQLGRTVTRVPEQRPDLRPKDPVGQDWHDWD